MIEKLNERARSVLQHVVAAYVETGAPIGSRTISRLSDMSLSAASIRNVMADLEAAGLLYAPHTSAGRLPTDLGLRLFVDGLLEVGDLTEDERASIEGRCADGGHSMQDMLQRATDILSGLSHCAGVVAVPNEVFYVDPARGRNLVRFACCKRPEVIDEAVERLGRLKEVLA